MKSRPLSEVRAERKERREDLDMIDDPFLKKMIQRRINDLTAEIRWRTQGKPCSGPGFSHTAHGACPGYSTDRT